ncbi:hypothetical protein MIR68_008291 [Amoeboaphelidium protococcarum]|nr:hypothetical protein MIR68_008291 [Amoeboaphelidium protococcarum]
MLSARMDSNQQQQSSSSSSQQPRSPEQDGAQQQSKLKLRSRNRDQQIRKKYAPSSPVITTTTPSKYGRHQSSQQQIGAGRSSSSNTTPLASAKPGTVAQMMPSSPVIVNDATSVRDVCRAMAGHHIDAVLVTQKVGNSHELCGIVTDKDIAFRLVAEGLDPQQTKIGDIMTKNPVFVDEDANVDYAMNLMFEGHFRHLPVLRKGGGAGDGDGGEQSHKIVGLLDIAKILQHIQSKINNSWGTVTRLLGAFEAFQKSWYNFQADQTIENWFKEMKDRMIEPDLADVVGTFRDHKSVVDVSMDVKSNPSTSNTADRYRVPCVNVKTSVREAAEVMRRYRQTAVLIYSVSPEQVMQGIFTTKDIVLRVLATGTMDPSTTSVIRVMTPQPDFATVDMKVNDALDKMYRGRYLHLPVVKFLPGKTKADATVVYMSEIAGLVDILGLGYRVIEGLIEQQAARPSPRIYLQSSNSVNDAAGGVGDGDANQENRIADEDAPGPMWSKFWESTAEEMEAAHQQLHSGQQNYNSSSVTRSTASEEIVHERVNPSLTGSQSTVVPANQQVDSFVFKVKDPLSKARHVHKFTSRYILSGADGDADSQKQEDCLQLLVEKICQVINCQHITDQEYQAMKKEAGNKETELYEGWKLVPQKGSATKNSNNLVHHMSILYKDDEDDFIRLKSQEDLQSACLTAQRLNWTRLTVGLSILIENLSTKEIKIVTNYDDTGAQSTRSKSLIYNHSDDEDDVANLLSLKASALSGQHQRTLQATSKNSQLGFYVGATGVIVGAVSLGMLLASKLRQQ